MNCEKPDTFEQDIQLLKIEFEKQEAKKKAEQKREAERIQMLRVLFFEKKGFRYLKCKTYTWYRYNKHTKQIEHHNDLDNGYWREITIKDFLESIQSCVGISDQQLKVLREEDNKRRKQAADAAMRENNERRIRSWQQQEAARWNYLRSQGYTCERIRHE